MKDKFSCDQCDYVPTQRNSNSKKSHFLKEKGAAKSRFLDSGVAVTPPPMDQMTSNFTCEDLLGCTFDFCQGCVSSTKCKPVLASKCNWPLYRSCDLDLNNVPPIRSSNG